MSKVLRLSFEVTNTNLWQKLILPSSKGISQHNLPNMYYFE